MSGSTDSAFHYGARCAHVETRPHEILSPPFESGHTPATGKRRYDWRRYSRVRIAPATVRAWLEFGGGCRVGFGFEPVADAGVGDDQPG